MSNTWNPDKHFLMMLMDIERPFVEEPFVPEQRNDPPEIPYKGLAGEVSFGKLSFHVMVSQSPVPKIDYIKKNIIDDRQDQYAEGPVPECSP
jgi:hypothetical protein